MPFFTYATGERPRVMPAMTNLRGTSITASRGFPVKIIIVIAGI
jgi:hypothetical protein